MPRVSGVSRRYIGDFKASWRDRAVLFVPDRSGIGERDGRLRSDMRHVVHRCDSIRGHGDFAPGFRLIAFVFTFVSAAIWSGIRCVGQLHTTRIRRDLVAPHRTTAASFTGSAATTTFFAVGVK